MTDFTTLPIEDLYESTLQSDLGSTDLIAKTVKNITGTLTGGDTCYMGINYDRPSKYELVEISAISGQNVTITNRAVITKAGGTPVAQNHPAGSKVIITHSYKVFEDIKTAIASKANSLAPTIDEATFTDWVKLPSYANAAARDVAIPAPTKNMTVILDNDGDSKLCLSTYSGSVWRNITLPGRDVTINGFLSVVDGYVKFPIYADATARNAGIPVPVPSMVVYNTAAVTLQLYDGSNWIDLDIGTPVPLATTSVAGRTRLATDAQVIARTDSISSEPLVIQPSQIELGNTLTTVAEEDLIAGDLVGASSYLSQTEIRVAKAFKTRTDVTFASTISNIRKVLPLDSTRFFVLYETFTGSLLSGVVIDYNINTNTVTTLGTKVDFVTADLVSGSIAVDLIDTDKIALVFVRTATNTITRVIIATIAGVVITAGAEQNLHTGTAANFAKIVGVNTNKAVVFIRNSASVLISFSVSGTTITAGGTVTPTANLISSQSVLLKIDTDKFILARQNTTTGYANVGTLSGIVITLSAEQTFATGGTDNNSRGSVYFLDTNKVIVSYRSTGTADPDEIACLTISGTTVTKGTPTARTTVNQEYLRLSATEFLYNIGTSIYKGVVTGSDIVLALVSTFASIVPVSKETRTALIGGLGFGFTFSGTTFYISRQGMSPNFIGQVLASASRGANINVKLNRPALTLSGLKGGEYYNLSTVSLTGNSYTNTYNGVPTMVNPITTSATASFLPINGLLVALKEDMAVAL